MSKLFRTGGGFLNNVQGVITGVRCYAEASKNGDFQKLMIQLSIRQDGAEVDVQPWPFFAGSAEGLTLNDGPSFESEAGDDFRLGGKTDWSDLLLPMIAGCPELEDRLTPTDYSGLVGTRCTFTQETDVEKTKKFGKQKSADGSKEYDRKNLRIEVLELASVKAGKLGVKPIAKGKPVAAKAVDASALANEVLLQVVDEAGGSIEFKRIKMLAFGKFKKGAANFDQRDAVLAYLGDSTNLLGLDGVTFDGKKQIVSLAA